MIKDKYIIGHRGIEKRYIDNSNRSILNALYHNCDFVEIDVRMSKDGNFFLYHDDEIKILSLEREDPFKEIDTIIENENSDILSINF